MCYVSPDCIWHLSEEVQAVYSALAWVIWLIPKQDIPINVLTMTKSVYSHTTEIAAAVTESEALATLMAHENLGPSFLL